MKRIPLYPLKFEPILKEKIWGGEKLHQYFNKDSKSRQLGESWEISAVNGDVSVVSNGLLKGSSLQEILNNYTKDLVGEKNFDRFGLEFPLLLKFIDAKEDLSIQLHPNDKLARERHNSFGKTEMWYVMQADQDAKLIIGFHERVNQSEYLQHLKRKSLTEILNFHAVKEGDTYFIESGRVHAIGAGVLLAEIQQTSDVTYRVYDWDRVDDQGMERELHNDLAIDAIDFNMNNDFNVGYTKDVNISNEMIACPYFKTNFIPIMGAIEKVNDKDSFLIYMCVDGEIELKTESSIENLKKGETLLIPASIKKYKISGKNAKLLEVYV